MKDVQDGTELERKGAAREKAQVLQLGKNLMRTALLSSQIVPAEAVDALFYLFGMVTGVGSRMLWVAFLAVGGYVGWQAHKLYVKLDRPRTRDVQIQSQSTYTWHTAQPRFRVLGAGDQ